MEFITLAAGFLGTLAVIWRLAIVPLHKIIDRATQFFDDWTGEAGRPGVPARPGVMERLERLEKSADAVAAQVHTNGGSSMRDGLERIEAALGTKPEPGVGK